MIDLLHTQMVQIQRRALLKLLAYSPLLSVPFSFAQPPAALDARRIVCLEWLPIEMLFALGITPYAVADKRNYQLWVEQPALADSVIEVGLRTEPNMELLQQLKPSLFLLTEGFGPKVSSLETIAPCVSISVNNASGHPLAAARSSLTALAKYLDKQPQAQAHLQQLDREIQETRRALISYSGKPLLLMSFLDTRHVLIFGRGSLFLDVLDELKLTNAWQGETNYWGSAIVGIERLAEFSDINVLCFSHGDNALEKNITSNPLWRALPIVRQNSVNMVSAVWFYGATLAAMRFNQILQHTLRGK